MIPAPTIGQMLSTHARLQPAWIGARDLDREMTFVEWNARACKLANALLGLGLAQGDRVAVLAWNRIEWLEIYAAVAKAGLIAVPINFRLVAQEIRFIIDNCQAAAVIAEAGLHPAIEDIRDDIDIATDRFIFIGSENVPVGWKIYENLIASGADREPALAVTAADPWCLMYTSGTTGNPKGAIRGHGGMAMLGLMTEIELGLTRRDEALLVMPMCHANSLNFFTAFLYCGATTNVFSRASFDPELCLRTLAQTGTTFTSLVPTHYELMLEAPRPDENFGRIEKLLVSSAPARVDTKRRVMEMFPNSGLFELYGSTEAGWVTMLHPDEQFDHLGSVGREVVGSLPIRLLDDNGNDVPDGAPGELYSCGPYAFDGYWNLPEKTAEAFRGDYLSVGDVAMRNEEGFICLLDRKKNMIITGGENVYPAEIEAVLAQHPAVRDAAVFGQPDDRWGERVAAAVVLRDDMTAASDELIDWCRSRLAGYKRPRTVTFLSANQMPRTATGKIQHNLLREMLAAPGHDRPEATK
jgi:fatty-acyl-CoA synthase